MTKKPRTAEEILILQHRRAKAAELAKKAVCIALVLVTLIPFYISVIYSIKYKNEVTISHLAWPKNPTLDNYIRVITENEQFLVGLKNSVLTTVPTIFGFTARPDASPKSNTRPMDVLTSSPPVLVSNSVRALHELNVSGLFST